jgi:hypothetical protein
MMWRWLKLFSELEDILSDDIFEEIPVDAKTFVESPEYLGFPPLSDRQYLLLEGMTQIYRKETLYEVYDKEYADYLSKFDIREVIGMLGKGSGKNHTTIIAVCRVVYLLLCLRDPAAYYGKPPGDSIHILNVAVNAKQAQNTFFKPLLARIKMIRWFDGKYESKQGEISFDKNITAYSGHSEREAWEGYNLIMVVLDEIAAFLTEAEASSRSSRSATAQGLYDMYEASVTSRFPDVGKLILLSFPRFASDFISHRYEQVSLEKAVQWYEHEFVVNEDLPLETPGNKFTIKWFEEEITTYREDRVMAMRSPSFRVNPSRKIEDYKKGLMTNPVDTLSRFFCNPPESVDSFFRDREKLEYAFKDMKAPFFENWEFTEQLKPRSDVNYYMHVDLAQKNDRAAIAMTHVEEWVEVGSGSYKTIEPIVKLDALRWWTPSPQNPVNFKDVKEYIFAVQRRGFNIQVISFDRWAGSAALQVELEAAGMNVEVLSADRKVYNDLQLLIYEQRLKAYNIPLLIEELMGLRVTDKGKVDHTYSGSNDLADALAGAVHLSAANEQPPRDIEIQVHNLDESLIHSVEAERPEPKKRKTIEESNTVAMPVDLSDWLDSLESI